MAKIGKTTGNLKMRSGPGMQYEPPIAYLVPDTQLEILEDLGDWLHVKADGKEGYVGQKYVAILPDPEPVKEAPKSDMERRAAPTPEVAKPAAPKDEAEKQAEAVGSIKKGGIGRGEDDKPRPATSAAKGSLGHKDDADDDNKSAAVKVPRRTGRETE